MNKEKNAVVINKITRLFIVMFFSANVIGMNSAQAGNCGIETENDIKELIKKATDTDKTVKERCKTVLKLLNFKKMPEVVQEVEKVSNERTTEQLGININDWDYVRRWLAAHDTQSPEAPRNIESRYKNPMNKALSYTFFDRHMDWGTLATMGNRSYSLENLAEEIAEIYKKILSPGHLLITSMIKEFTKLKDDGLNKDFFSQAKVRILAQLNQHAEMLDDINGLPTWMEILLRKDFPVEVAKTGIKNVGISTLSGAAAGLAIAATGGAAILPIAAISFALTATTINRIHDGFRVSFEMLSKDEIQERMITSAILARLAGITLNIALEQCSTLVDSYEKHSKDSLGGKVKNLEEQGKSLENKLSETEGKLDDAIEIAKQQIIKEFAEQNRKLEEQCRVIEEGRHEQIAFIQCQRQIFLEFEERRSLQPRRQQARITDAPYIQIRTFLYAAKNGDFQTLEKCIEEGVPLATTDDEGRNALHLACTGGHVRCAYILLEKHNMEVNDVIHNSELFQGWTPLHFACLSPNENLVHLLLKKNAAVFIKNASDETPLDVARRKGFDPIISLLQNWNQQQPPICAICYEKFGDANELRPASADPCGHVFHYNCATKHTSFCNQARHPVNCPICRNEINSWVKLYYTFEG